MAFNFLVVDDSNIARKVIVKTLGLSGVPVGTIFEAAHGAEALDIIHSQWIDLVFLDINMPVMDGIEFIRELREDPEQRSTPVVIVSTEGSRVRKAELADYDVKAYLRKPVQPENIAETVRDALGWRA